MDSREIVFSCDFHSISLSHSFQFSGLDSKNRKKYEQILNDIPGVEIRSESRLCSETTHLIAQGVSQTEKFLSALARGIWYGILLCVKDVMW